MAYLVFVGWITLTPQPYGQQTASLLDRALRWFAQHDATSWITFDAVERGANIALFIPIGVLLLLLFGHRWWWLAIVLGASFSVAIELYQRTWLPTRVADVGDVITNTIGTIIGVALAALLTLRTERQRRRLLAQEQQLAEARATIARLSDSGK